jgi:hypothetical protein
LHHHIIIYSETGSRIERQRFRNITNQITVLYFLPSPPNFIPCHNAHSAHSTVYKSLRYKQNCAFVGIVRICKFILLLRISEFPGSNLGRKTVSFMVL